MCSSMMKGLQDMLSTEIQQPRLRAEIIESLQKMME